MRHSRIVALISATLPIISAGCMDGRHIVSPQIAVPGATCQKYPSATASEYPLDIFPDNHTFLYAHFASADLPAGLYMRDTAQAATPKFIQPLVLLAPWDTRISPDGQWFAYSTREVFIRNLATGEVRQITHTNGNAAGPDWDPTSRYITYYRIFRGYNEPDFVQGLALVDVTTGEERSLRHDGQVTSGASPRWSPDGKSIVFFDSVYLGKDHSGRPIQPWHIFRQNVDGTGYIDLTPGDYRKNWFPEWSPDGSQIIFTSAPWDSSSFESRRTDVMNADGSGRTQWPYSLTLGASRLSRDWRYIIYDDCDPDSAWTQIYLQDARDGDITKRRQLTTWSRPLASASPAGRSPSGGPSRFTTPHFAPPTSPSPSPSR